MLLQDVLGREEGVAQAGNIGGNELCTIGYRPCRSCKSMVRAVRWGGVRRGGAMALSQGACNCSTASLVCAGCCGTACHTMSASCGGTCTWRHWYGMRSTTWRTWRVCALGAGGDGRSPRALPAWASGGFLEPIP